MSGISTAKASIGHFTNVTHHNVPNIIFYNYVLDSLFLLTHHPRYYARTTCEVANLHMHTRHINGYQMVPQSYSNNPPPSRPRHSSMAMVRRLPTLQLQVLPMPSRLR